MAKVTGDYKFSAEPRTVKAQHPKYRDEEEIPSTNNIMFDKRVIRGNTYAAMIVPPSAQQEMERQKVRDQKRKAQLRQQQEQMAPDLNREAHTPEPLENREHQDMQTDDMLEGLFDAPVVYEVETQTDPYVDRPPTPLKMPVKIGDDVDTQVEDGDLFSFDLEVDPILEVLVSKSMEHARMEVLEEEELLAMRKHIEEFAQKRESELIEVQRLEAEELRRREEAERKKSQARTKKEQIQQAHKKYVARIFTKKYLSKLRLNVMDDLNRSGFYSEPLEISLQGELIQWLLKETTLSYTDESFSLCDSFLHVAFEAVVGSHRSALKVERDRRNVLAEERAEIERSTAERKDHRNELRKERQRKKEIAELKAKVQRELIDSCSSVENITSQVISDMDGRQSDAVVGTPGGLLGEIIGVLACLEDIKKQPLTPESILSVVYDILMNLKTSLHISLYRKSDFIAFIKSLNKKLNIGTVREAPEEIKHEVINYLMNRDNTVPRTVLGDMWMNPSSYNIREGLVENTLSCVLKLWLYDKLESEAPNNAQGKVEFTPENWPEQGNEIAVVRIRIPMVEEVIEGEAEDDDAEPPKTVEIKEIDPVEDRVLLVTPLTQNFSVFVLHQAAQRFLRDEIAHIVRGVSGFEGTDVEDLKNRLTERGEQREDVALKNFANELPVLDYEIN